MLKLLQAMLCPNCNIRYSECITRGWVRGKAKQRCLKCEALMVEVLLPKITKKDLKNGIMVKTSK
jgi:hypothetical protein